MTALWLGECATDPVQSFSSGISTVPKRYLSTLANYSRWSNCRTPLQQFAAFLSPFWLEEDEPLFSYKHPFDCLFVYESRGEKWPCSDTNLIGVLWEGKNTRDWWAKEINEWIRLGMRTPLFEVSEFKEMLSVHKCFDEVYSWWKKAILSELRKQRGDEKEGKE